MPNIQSGLPGAKNRIFHQLSKVLCLVKKFHVYATTKCNAVTITANNATLRLNTGYTEINEWNTEVKRRVRYCQTVEHEGLLPHLLKPISATLHRNAVFTKTRHSTRSLSSWIKCALPFILQFFKHPIECFPSIQQFLSQAKLTSYMINTNIYHDLSIVIHPTQSSPTFFL